METEEIRTLSSHVQEGVPCEWKHWKIGGERFIAHDVPEGSIRLYRVTITSRNVRVFASADTALYDGYVVNPHYHEPTNSVDFVHIYAGTKATHPVEEWLDEPAVKLEKIPPAGRRGLEAMTDG